LQHHYASGFLVARERIEDIPFLAEYFLLRARAKVNKKVDSIAPQALALLKNYSWPGNLHELENIAAAQQLSG
jgi:transcriptional regulator with PAS, ATPase and Fis domain